MQGAGTDGAVAASVVEEIETAGGTALADEHDVASPDGADALIETAVAEFGRLDILINDAAYNKSIPFDDLDRMTVEEWSKIIDVNLTGPFHCIKAVAPVMKKQGRGRIVNIASIAGLGPSGSSIAYAVSKAGLIHLTKCMAVALAPHVLVNCVAPAIVKTELFSQMTEQHIQYMLSKIPMNRFGEVEEVAEMVAWLASPLCTFATGAAFDLSGVRATY